MSDKLKAVRSEMGDKSRKLEGTLKTLTTILRQGIMSDGELEAKQQLIDNGLAKIESILAEILKY